MADPLDAGGASGAVDQPQPKAALHYRQGGDHCGVCMYFEGVGDGKGTCPKVTPPDVDSADLCDDFARAGREKPDREVASNAAAPGADVAGMADQLAKRGLISERARKTYVG